MAGLDACRAALDVLAAAPRRAMFATELATRLAEAGCGPADTAEALAAADSAGRLVVVPHELGDPHLAGIDLRVVALAVDRRTDSRQDARHRADAYWAEFLREFLATHRCT